MMDTEEFLSGYFRRIKYSGGRDINIQVLKDIAHQHSYTVPFENTYVVAGKVVSMNKTDLYQKIVVKKRGGFCYEVNMILYYVLADIGFETTLCGGRVFDSNRQRRDFLGHVVVVVKLDGDYFSVDCGCGGWGHYTVMPVNTSDEIKVGNGCFRFRQNGSEYFLQRKTPTIIDIDTKKTVRGGASDKCIWVDMYGFDLTPRTHEDFNIGLEFHCFDPSSRFRNQLWVTRMRESGKVVIAGNILRIYEFGSDGKQYSRQCELSNDGIESALVEHFGLEPL